MSNKTLYLVRGLSGSGKSTIARALAPIYNCCADDHFMINGEYRFRPEGLGEAHASCQKQTEVWMVSGVEIIAVHNTLTCSWEAMPYRDLAERYGYGLRVVDLYDSGKTDQELSELNLHGVSLDILSAQRARYQSLKDFLYELL